ncbi:hypothetical protein GCM10009555_064420 [Acrocarpospora macrocephala]|uniref:Uncharacterized protein n=1 Tax=Acrocarpospora macrocephala TaxID=150177 RepID=A0A5M3WL34_9ACTN|nr:hypothetical protein [Acrocarpospora macrocephala]GES07623.1 hypothetical protein Amac_012180 [Acrocarpospora macrocephala]
MLPDRALLLAQVHNHGPAEKSIRDLLEAQVYQRVVTLGIDDGYVLRRRSCTSRRYRHLDAEKN